MPVGHVIEVVDVHGRRLHLDAALQVVTGEGTGYLDGNVHTHRGRFGVWCPGSRVGLAVSLSEIVSMTDEAACWIAGFLAGNEPGLEEYLGIDHLDADTDIEPTGAELDRWRAFTARFRQTGDCPRLNARPTQPLPMSPEARRELGIEGWVPWSYAGERVWVERNETWVEADPQPEVVEQGFLPGSACDARACHDFHIDTGSPRWQVCSDCAYVDFTPGAVVIES